MKSVYTFYFNKFILLFYVKFYNEKELNFTMYNFFNFLFFFKFF